METNCFTGHFLTLISFHVMTDHMLDGVFQVFCDIYDSNSKL